MAEYLSGSQDQKVKQETKARFVNTDITNQDFRKSLKNFNNSPYLGYKSEQVQDKPTEANLLLIRQVVKPMKYDMQI